MQFMEFLSTNHFKDLSYLYALGIESIPIMYMIAQNSKTYISDDDINNKNIKLNIAEILKNRRSME